MIVGDEIITCTMCTRVDRWGAHLHDDQCWEVRTIIRETEGCSLVSDLVSGKPKYLLPDDMKVAPVPLLRRKTDAFARLVKLLADWEIWDQASAHCLLDRVLIEVDRYLFCGEASSLMRGELVAPDKTARLAFERAALYALEHRRDFGMGRQSSVIVKDISRALREGLSASTSVAPLIRERFLTRSAAAFRIV
jgi:hypothetical protein